MARIPLRRRDGTITAYAIVDAADYEWLMRWRWHLDSHGYAKRSLGRAGKWRTILMHRVILGLEHGDPRMGDHKNRDPLDNRCENLRIAERGMADNGQNKTPQVGCTSRYRGVTWHKQCQKWQAYATLDDRKHYLGLFTDEYEAAVVAAAFRAEHMAFSEEAR